MPLVLESKAAVYLSWNIIKSFNLNSKSKPALIGIQLSSFISPGKPCSFCTGAEPNWDEASKLNTKNKPKNPIALRLERSLDFLWMK